jgi:hypothetical protein
MPRPPKSLRAARRSAFRGIPRTVLLAALAAALVACGGQGGSSAEAKAEQALKACRAQWRDVGNSVLGMDQDTNPSALADRWTTVIATVEYYQNTDTAKACQDRIEAQLKAVTALRQFSEKLRPYDMTYQLAQVRAAVDLYLNDPLPDAVSDDTGRKVEPPTKAAVTAAMQTLSENAEQANVELQPGWEQTSAVDLTDVSALTQTMQDLDFLAQDSPHWRACEEALQVLVAAIRAQEGLSGSSSVTPSASRSGG